METEAKRFGRRLTTALKARGYRSKRQSKTGVDAIRLAGEMGVTRRAAEKWIEGLSIPERDNCRKLAKLLNISYFWLTEEIGTMEPGILDKLLIQLSPVVENLESKSDENEFESGLLAYAELLARKITDKNNNLDKD